MDFSKTTLWEGHSLVKIEVFRSLIYDAERVYFEVTKRCSLYYSHKRFALHDLDVKVPFYRFQSSRKRVSSIAGDSTLNVNFAASFQDGTAACVASNTIAHWTEAITQLDGEFKFEPENLQYRNYLQGAMLLMDTCWVTKRSHTRLSWKRMRYHEDELLVC